VRKILLFVMMALLMVVLVGCEGDKEEVGNKSNDRTNEFSKLEILDVDYQNDKVLIAGTTDLPVGSKLSVSLDVAGRPETAAYIGVTSGVEVINGKFSTELLPPNHPEFIGPYVVEVLFTPRNQSDSVLKLVGKDGEYLKGDSVQESFGFNIMRVSREVDIKLKASSQKPQSVVESEKLQIHVDFLKSIYNSINQKYNEQRNNYDKLEWASFANETRANIDKNRNIFTEEFPVGLVLPENANNVFSINDLYIKIHVDLIKEMWNDLDGTGGNVQAVKDEITGVFNSIKLR